MRLSKFILPNLEEILAEWESFASTVLPGKQFDKATLRNDAAEILKTIAKDMETPQTSEQQTVKSKGRSPKTPQDTSAERHSNVRIGQGFNQVQTLSEFRALRATVIRLWMNSSPELDDSGIYQLIRFNEGIDQALSESAPVKLAVSVESDHVVFRVYNEGSPIPESALQTIFDLTPRRRKEDQNQRISLAIWGLGYSSLRKSLKRIQGPSV